MQNPKKNVKHKTYEFIAVHMQNCAASSIKSLAAPKENKSTLTTCPLNPTAKRLFQRTEIYFHIKVFTQMLITLLFGNSKI